MADPKSYSIMLGCSAQYAETSKMQFNDDTDYGSVDFCQGNEVTGDEKSLFDEKCAFDSFDSALNDCLFNFDAENDDESLG